MSAQSLIVDSPPLVGTPRVAVCPSAGLRRIRHLTAFLALDTVLSPGEARRAGVTGDVVLAWGRKPSARRAERFARARGLPLWYLEDGWIRSASADAHSPTCYSVLVDPVGVYYDSSRPSAIERFLNRPDAEVAGDLDAVTLARAGRARQRLVAANITKYNYCPTSRLPVEDGREIVLVVDQTRDDASVRCGGMDEAGFVAMLDAACAENPDARVIVRTHPDVVTGRRRGYLDRLARDRGLELSGSGDDPLPWLKRAARIYVGTSQLGYEALLCERPVTVFGQPFYAAWGLSDDRSPVRRRVHRRTVDQLFHAAHVHLARYVSPLTGERWTLDDCLDHVALQRREFARNARPFVCEGIAPWKRRYVERFLRSPSGSVRFGDGLDAAPSETRLCWGFRGAPLEGAAPTWRMEDGFLRSNGLGSDFVAPGSLVVDTRGIYFDPSVPSDLEMLLRTRDCTLPEIARASRLRATILAAGLSKYNVGRSVKTGQVPADKRKVLVVGQVEDDESIRRGCPGVATNAELLRAVRAQCPEAWIVYRPHPDVEAGNRIGGVDARTLADCADAIDRSSPVGDTIDDCDELHTMTSLAGFEALMRGRDVVTWGVPFYAGWGLTRDTLPTPERRRARSLDELVFLTLIAYPRYIDIESGEFTDAENTVRSIVRSRDAAGECVRTSAFVPRRLVRRVAHLRNVVRGLRYAP